MIDGLNEASTLCAGVGGYLKIMYIDGREKQHMNRLKELNDSRCKLASEIVVSLSAGLIARKHAIKLLDDLVYNDKPFNSIDKQFKKSATDEKGLLSFLRGY